MMAECDRQIEQLTQQLNGKNVSGPKPSASSPSTHKHRKNQFHCDMGSELKRVLGVDLERFPNSRGLFDAAEGGIFFHPSDKPIAGDPGGKMPLDRDGFGLHQFGNRCNQHPRYQRPYRAYPAG